MGEVVSSKGTVGVLGLMPSPLPCNYFSYKLFSRSDAVFLGGEGGFKAVLLI